jgi:hypothetical protein
MAFTLASHLCGGRCSLSGVMHPLTGNTPVPGGRTSMAVERRGEHENTAGILGGSPQFAG